MSRFFGEGTNGRGNTVPFGGRNGDAGEMHLRGWDAGVRVVPFDDNGKDAFRVYMTTGSHGAGQSQLIGTVRDTMDHGPEFTPGWGSCCTHLPEWIGPKGDTPTE